MVFGLVLIVAYWLDLVANGSLVEIQTSAVCPLMLGVMLFRPRLYAGHHTAHHPDAAKPLGAMDPSHEALLASTGRTPTPSFDGIAGFVWTPHVRQREPRPAESAHRHERIAADECGHEGRGVTRPHRRQFTAHV